MLVLDIGGTSVKFALTDGQGKIIPSTVSQTASRADGTYEDFLTVLSGIIDRERLAGDFGKACVSTAGPFDYDAGVSLMKHKFQALYGKTLRTPFEAAGVEVSFLHDSTSFMLGEAYDGAAKGQNAPCCVMLGTGLGFAFMRDGKVCVNEKRTPYRSLWNIPWREGIAEDYVSTRALWALYGEQIPIRELAERSRSGDRKAVDAFRKMGAELSQILKGIIPELGCSFFVLGGQIAKSAELFELEIPCSWSVSEHLNDAALRGAAYYALHGRAACETIPSQEGIRA